MFRALIEYALCGCDRARIKIKTEWDVESAIATYNVDRWGGDYFTINSAGNVEGAAASGKRWQHRHPRSRERSALARSRFSARHPFQDLLRHRVEARSTARFKPR
jgi:arginine decarboxylase